MKRTVSYTFLLAGAWTLRGLLGAEPFSSEDFRLELTSATCAPGGEADIFLLSSHHLPIFGFQASLYLPDGVALLVADAEACNQGGIDACFLADADGCPAVCGSAMLNTLSGPGCAALGIILDMTGAGRIIDPAERVRVAHLRLLVSGEVAPGAVLPLELRDGCRGIGNRVSVASPTSGAANVVPTLAPGMLEVADVLPPLSPPAFTIPPKARPAKPLIVRFLQPRETEACEAEVGRYGAKCPQIVLPLDGDTIAGSAFGEPGLYAVRLRLGSAAGWGPWSDPAVVEISDGLWFLRADTNGDGRVDISDPIATLGWLFLGSGKVPCQAAADANGEGKIDISDAVHTLGFLFLGGPAPPPPHPQCGPAPSGGAETGALDCLDPGSCRA